MSEVVRKARSAFRDDETAEPSRTTNEIGEWKVSDCTERTGTTVAPKMLVRAYGPHSRVQCWPDHIRYRSDCCGCGLLSANSSYYSDTDSK